MNLRWIICIASLAAIGIDRAEAQTAQPPAGRLHVSFGAGWLGGASFGDQPADLRSASGGPYRLFESDTSLGGTGLFEARLGYALSRRFTVEGRAAINKPQLETVVSSDAEASGSFTAVEDISQYVFDGGVLIHLDEGEAFGLKPFVTGGAGYVRQLHEDQLVETGHLFYVGGGVTRPLFSRAQGFIRSGSIRADFRLNVLSLELEADSSRLQGSVSASFVVGF
jgi:hypothetical protein